MTIKLLDTTGGNTKLGKTNKSAGGVYRVAGLSLMPSDILCPARHVAGCASACLESAGRGRMSNVIDGRQRKADWFASDPDSFLAQLSGAAHHTISGTEGPFGRTDEASRPGGAVRGR